MRRGFEAGLKTGIISAAKVNGKRGEGACQVPMLSRPVIGATSAKCTGHIVDVFSSDRAP